MSCEADRSCTSPLLPPHQADNWLIDPSDIEFWTNAQSLDFNSSEYLSKVQSLLNSPSNVALARSFHGRKAQLVIDFLHQALARTRLDDDLWRQSLRLIRKLSKTQGILPTPYILQREDIHVGEIRFEGGFGIVSDGEYQGNNVAIKLIKVDERVHDKAFKRLCREVIVWKHLSHPNILPLLGVSISINPHSFRILTEWMPNGNVSRYTEVNPTANRLQLLSEVMSAMTYLHDLKVVHGDLKAANVLVDQMGAALIADFGRLTMDNLSAFLSESIDSSGGTYRWMSPELLHSKMYGTKCLLTRESDCYALGMVIYEVLTGLKPFHGMHGLTFIMSVLDRGVHPDKPLDAEAWGFSDALWELVMLCWSHTSSSRPTARELLDYFSRASPDWVSPAEYPVPVTEVSSTDSGSGWSGSLQGEFDE
ncbi:kinase-like domain-containing protein [Thelephora terrestris]|uniref:Kinase-like domain-containing protein n=1 Tax=Thelephora terrestris TaxID=56493 RepID=A0A9P6HM96_9AGAM|nr:kinase-like domain-containing protein [Thelephora terrestris]